MRSERSKLVEESETRRVYRAGNGSAMSCSLQHQKRDDPDDGQRAGWWGWCGPVEDQSDYVIGPYDSPAEVFAAYEKRNPKHVRMLSVTLFQTQGPEFHPRLRRVK